MKNDKSNLKNKILSDFKKFIKNSSFHKMNFNNKMVNKKVSEYIYIYILVI